MIKRFNISKPVKYQDLNGNEKTQWNNVGTLVEFHNDDGSVSRLVEIPAIGLKAPAFEQKPQNGHRNDAEPKDGVDCRYGCPAHSQR